jgi:hypothetical protein
MHVSSSRLSSKLGVIFILNRTFLLSTPTFKQSLAVTIEQGGEVIKAAIDGANETIDSLTNTRLISSQSGTLEEK